MKKKAIVEYMNEIKMSKKTATEIGPELEMKGAEVVVDDNLEEGKDDHEGQSCKEAHPKMSHKAWKKNMEESDTLDLNLLEKEIYEDIKNEEYGKMSKKEILEMIGFSKVNENCIGYHFHGKNHDDSGDGDYGKKRDAMLYRKASELEDKIECLSEDEVIEEDGVETKPKVKPTTKPAEPKRRHSPFNPTPGKKTAPAKGELTDAERKQIEDIIGTMDEGDMTESIITITTNLLNV
jgi:hypothetical protein